MVPCPASDLLKTAWINLPRAGVVLTVWIAIRTGEHILGRQQNRSDLCFNANMIGRKALHHVYLMADNTASPWLVFGSRLFRAFPWGSSERALISEKNRTMRNQFRNRLVMAALTSQAMFPGVLIAIRVIQNSVVKEKCSPN